MQTRYCPYLSDGPPISEPHYPAQCSYGRVLWTHAGPVVPRGRGHCLALAGVHGPGRQSPRPGQEFTFGRAQTAGNGPPPGPPAPATPARRSHCRTQSHRSGPDYGPHPCSTAHRRDNFPHRACHEGYPGLSDKVIVLNYGEKIAEGPPQEVANDPQVITAYLGQKRLT